MSPRRPSTISTVASRPADWPRPWASVASAPPARPTASAVGRVWPRPRPPDRLPRPWGECGLGPARPTDCLGRGASVASAPPADTRAPAAELTRSDWHESDPDSGPARREHSTGDGQRPEQAPHREPFREPPSEPHPEPLRSGPPPYEAQLLRPGGALQDSCVWIADLDAHPAPAAASKEEIRDARQRERCTARPLARISRAGSPRG